MPRRTEQVVLTLFEEEKADLKALADEDMLPVATWLRQLIKHERRRRDDAVEAAKK